MDIKGGSAVVTGGASGLGLATARRLADAGAHVILLDLPGSEGAAAAKELGGSADFAPADVTDEEAVAAAYDIAEKRGPLRAVVNCAGLGTPARVLTKEGKAAPLAAYRKIIDVNLVGSYNVIRLGAERMVQTDPVDGERGVVVNTASVAAFD
ncbi:3-hydroxy-2-methylbutyryl-CoA dehydrogenase, partial [Streptomyces regensis]